MPQTVYQSRSSDAQPVWVVGEDGKPASFSPTDTYTLASNQAVAANSGTTPVTNVRGGSYVFDVQFTGTSVKLQSLGSDGTTWRDIGAAITSPGAVGVVIGQGASVRLYNPNGTGLTGVYASLT
jgi:hypothetical protein